MSLQYEQKQQGFYLYRQLTSRQRAGDLAKGDVNAKNAQHISPGTPWITMTSGSGSDLAVRESVARDIAVENYQCPEAPEGRPDFKTPCERLVKNSSNS